MIQDKIDGQFNSIDELCEFFYRIAKHVYDQSNYSQEINKIPKGANNLTFSRKWKKKIDCWAKFICKGK